MIYKLEFLLHLEMERREKREPIDLDSHVDLQSLESEAFSVINGLCCLNCVVLVTEALIAGL